jgi:tRNA 2-thiouridine synthesizing protein A
MKKTIDARGLSCPQPVILASKAISNGLFPIDVLVDTATARENVRRVSEHAGLHVSIKEEGDEFILTITE